MSDIQLLHGDCFDLLPMLPVADLIIADPPYNLTECRWETKIDLKSFFQVAQVTTHGAICVFGTQPFTTDLINSCREQFKYCWYWVKNAPTNHRHAKNRPMAKVEEIAVFSRGAVAHFGRSQRRMNYFAQGAVPGEVRTIKKDESPNHQPRPLQVGRSYQTFHGFPSNVLSYAKEKSWHPTAKPVELLRFLIRSYTRPGDLVIDPFAGSGSTLLAARLEGRRAIGIERDAEYYERASCLLNE